MRRAVFIHATCITCGVLLVTLRTRATRSLIEVLWAKVASGPCPLISACTNTAGAACIRCDGNGATTAAVSLGTWFAVAPANITVTTLLTLRPLIAVQAGAHTHR